MYASALLNNGASEIHFQFSDKPEYTFFKDVIRGLTANPKFLDSKYFYDAAGDKIFQQIMNCEEYYLTNCELDILRKQSWVMAKTISSAAESISKTNSGFDIVELGPGDASKSIYLLENLRRLVINYTYYPIDISANLLSYLESTLSLRLPGVKIAGLNGEYTDMLDRVNELTGKRKVIMFMGASIGNFSPGEALEFFIKVQQKMNPGDLLLTGFDLKKNPHIILDAYNDKQGITREFNFNLLRRINNTLGADFDLDQFEHYPVYDPESGSCRSYIISLKDQIIHIGESIRICFSRHESILMEVSQKYDIEQISQLAFNSGFKVMCNYFDSRRWFVDTLWVKE